MHVPNIRAKKCLQVKELTATIRYVSADSTTWLIHVLKRGQFVFFFKKRNKASLKQGNPKRDSGPHLSSPTILQVNHSEICALLGSYAAQE
jgi:hypothetical protein